MDITEKSPRVLSLCSGYGGIELGLNRIFGKVSVVAYVEIEAFAIANLVDKMEKGLLAPAPIWTNVKTFRGEIFRGDIDILIGGYPCQPFSAAGKRKGAEDPRHLWPHIRRCIEDTEPTWVFLENVEGHLSLGISEVLADLEEMGYNAEVGIFSAEEVGAPHRRKRVFILGNSDVADPSTDGSGRGLPDLHNPDESIGESEKRREKESAEPYHAGETRWPARPGEEQYDWEEPRTIVDDPGSR